MKMRKYLLKLIDEDSGQTIQKLKLREGLKYLVGRSKKADVVIADEAVKRKILHVSLEDEEGKAFIIPKTTIQINGVDAEKGERVKLIKGQAIIKFGESNYYLLLKEKSKKKNQIEEEADTEEKEELDTQIAEEQEEEEEVKEKKTKKDKKSKKQNQLKSLSAEEEEDQTVTHIKEVQNTQQTKQQPTDKRKLLWAKKGDDVELEKKAQIYGKVEASSEETNKFFKLLGFKKEVEGKKVQVNAQNFFIKKSGLEKHSMMTNLENQFNVSVNRKNTKGGLGMN